MPTFCAHAYFNFRVCVYYLALQIAHQTHMLNLGSDVY